MSNPFNNWLNTQPKVNDEAKFDPNEYIDCWYMALGRMAVLINVSDSRSNIFHSKLLKRNDENLLSYFGKYKELRRYYTLGSSSIAGNYYKDDEIVSDFFYGYFEKDIYRDGYRIKHYVTDAFMRESYAGIRLPVNYSNTRYEDLQKRHTSKYMRSATAAYLLRNFLHNYVHNFCQNITHNNYQRFRGWARETSDFEADCLSLLLLCKAYAIPVRAGDLDRLEPIPEVIELLKKVRSNSLFRRRSEKRQEEEKKEDRDWRICRATAGYLSGYLLAQGLAVPDIRVCFSESNTFLIRINSIWFNYEQPYYKIAEKNRERYLYDLSVSICNEYRAMLRADNNMHGYAKKLINAQLSRIGDRIRAT